MADALKEAYGDLFLIKEKPTKSDQAAVTGKFKSFHNTSDDVAQRMTKTFFALLDLADLDAQGNEQIHASEPEAAHPESQPSSLRPIAIGGAGLHYNIQIHLPATKDVEVYNAIFKSLREHLVE